MTNLIYRLMIIDIWRPIFKGSGKNRKTLYYEITDIDDVLKTRKTGYVVRYLCDYCNSNIIKTTTSSSLFRKEYQYNTIESQTCRSCRTKICEYETKKTQIPFLVVLKSFEEEGYELLTTESEYNKPNRSQIKLKCVCISGHFYECTWNNWSRGKRCGECYKTNRFNNSVNSKQGWDMYNFLVWKYTNNNYKKYYNVINPLNLNRGKLKFDYNIDHKFSISEGFKNGITPKIIASVYNLEMLTRSENLSKGSKCSIKLENLLENFY